MAASRCACGRRDGEHTRSGNLKCAGVLVTVCPMTSMTRPRGPLPARVYWIRRAVVLGVVFLLVFGITRLFAGGSEEPTASQVSGAATSSKSGARDQGDPVVKKSGKAGKKKAKKAKKVLASPDGPCAPSEVSVGSTLRKAPAGSPEIAIPLEITTDREACTFVVSQRTVALKITSGDDLVWSSQHCGKVLGSHDVVVRRAQSATVTVHWDGLWSSAGCPTDEKKWALPGGYHAISAPFGGEPVDQYFELTDAEPEVIVKTRKAKKQKRADAAKEKKAERKKREKKAEREKKREQAEREKERQRNQPSDEPSTPTDERADGNGAQEP